MAYVAEQAVSIALNAVSTDADEGRLAELERQSENLIRLAAEVGHLSVHTKVLAELEREAQQIRSRLAVQRPLDRDVARARAEALVAALRELLNGPADEVRHAIGKLLGGERIAVQADPEAGFRISGTAVLDLEAKTPSPLWGAGRRSSVVAGVGFEPTTFGL